MRSRSPKITPPVVPAAVPRLRLWSRLDTVKRRGGAIWIAGAPGSGKTTLVASWLAALRHPTVWLRVDSADEDLATFFHFLAEAMRPRASRRSRLPSLAPGLDPEIFARRYFRALLGGVGKGTVLVLDDLGEVSGDGSALHRVVRVLLEELPRGATVVLASRGEPPSHLRAVADRALLADALDAPSRPRASASGASSPDGSTGSPGRGPRPTWSSCGRGSPRSIRRSHRTSSNRWPEESGGPPERPRPR
jgi:ATP/maltotriose-dependent transcriptional regulator MalT